MQTLRARRVLSAFRGSSWPVLVDAGERRVVVKLRGTAEGCLPLISEIVVGSLAAARPWQSAKAAAYAATKAALVGLIKAVAAEVLNDGVRVNALHPSTIDTAANRSSMPDADHSKWVSPESLSGVIAFLLSDAARDISGAEIPVYGRVAV